MEMLTGKTALVTGGSDGIGFAIATAFARLNARLILVGRDRSKLERKERELRRHSVDVLCIAKDAAHNEAAADIVHQIRKNGLHVDILVNNAGIARFIPFADTDDTALDAHIDLNVKAPYRLTRALVEDLIASKGCVVNISSYFARRMLPDRPSTAYSLSKGALESFTKALAFELGPSGVRVNAIAPGTVTTPQVATNMARLDGNAKNRFRAMIQSIYPLQTIGKPEDVANMAVFLVSDQARWITGGIFPVDGGLTTN